MKIWICAYRDWSLAIYNQISKEFDNIELIESKKEFEHVSSSFQEEDIIFFLGWSWIIPDDIVEKYNCICLHPSPLPKDRGGSPLQHQIINGESISAVTYFRMTDELDAGPILFQEEFSLIGDLKDVINRIIPLGIKGIFLILSNDIQEKNQDTSEATYYKRRKPIESEITLDEISNVTAEQLYNKIRALQDPYPNAYIKCNDGSKLYITRASYEK
jgi:methionyl-tRNA formyltransferase